MNKEKARAILKWLFCDPIQFWVLIIIIIIQWSVIYFFNLDPKYVNNYLGLALQIFGGVIILIIINGNTELFKKINLIGVFKNWVKSCPLIKKHYSLKAQSSIQLQVTLGKPQLTVKRNCKNINELNEELYRQVDEINKFILETESALVKRMATIEDTLKGTIEENTQEIQEVKELASESAIGDFKWEILGVLLVIYGAVIPII